MSTSFSRTQDSADRLRGMVSAVRLVCRSEDGCPVGKRQSEPVSCGVPWAEGTLRDVRHLTLLGPAGSAQPLQASALELWRDGSVRWAQLDWLATVDRHATYSALVNHTSLSSQPCSLATTTSSGRIEVHTGVADFCIAAKGSFPFESATLGDRPVLDEPAGGLRATDAAGNHLFLRPSSVEIEVPGFIRTVVLVRGQFMGKGVPTITDVEARLHFWRHSSTVRFDLTIRNSQAAKHPRGFWALGSQGSTFLREVALDLVPLASDSLTVRCSPEVGQPLETYNEPFEIYQDSSGGEAWASSVHVNRHGVVPTRFRGYRLRDDSSESFGLRATPILNLISTEGSCLTCTMEQFWQNFPKALEMREGRVALGLFPRQYGDDHEIQGGEQKTHTFHVAFGPDDVTSTPLDWCREPLHVRADPDWYSESKAVPYLLPRSQDENESYLQLIDSAIEGSSAFAAKREIVDEFGWRHFGDLYADHESIFNKGPEPLISHYNNQYDVVAGCAIHYLRTGDRRWRTLMDDLAHHVVDIDLYHTDGDKPAYNRGMFWHTFHYVDAGPSTHRSYPEHPAVPGGGPSPGHLYTTGLLMHYLLTGARQSREAVIRLGRYVINADDGSRTVFRFLASEYTGHVSESGADRYHGPGRTPANAINALLDAHRLSGERVFLEKAEQLIRRCIHPSDDLEKRNLLDAENRWYYTVFLQSLGKYLDHKANLGETDFMYCYGREALLAYAEWALEHEYPYLERPEKLEYPTETWAAQDMRKSEVFKTASRYVQEPQRTAFLSGARTFFDASVGKLEEMPTRSLCRPLAILLSNGYSQSYFEKREVAPAPEPHQPTYDFGVPRRFEAQKQVAKKNLLRIAAALAVGLTVFLLGWLLA